jgi:carboxypeptidase T
MKRNIISCFVLVAVLLGLASSAVATPLSSAGLPADQAQPQDVVAWVYFTSQDELNNLAARFDIMDINQEDKSALIILSPAEVTSLEQAGYRLEVDESKTKLLNQPLQALPGQDPNTIPGYPCYRTVEETYADMQAIANTHQDMAELIDIGDSWDKVTPGGNFGYDILALRLSNENIGVMDDKPTFFLMAEIHAREYTTAETAMRYAEYLINNYGTDPDITWMLDYFRVYIVTMTNPDGRKHAEMGQLWRKNVNNTNGCTDPNNWGTDLNRNHSFHWLGGGSSPYPCDETYRGPSAASEPETQAIQNFVFSIFPDQRGPGDLDPAPANTTGTFITLHSFARVDLYPWGWTTTAAPNSTQLATLGRKLGFFNGYEVCQSDSACMYPTNGTSDDWAYGSLGIASYTIEMGTSFFESCQSFASTTYPENLPALVYALKAARHPYMDPKGPESVNVSASPAAAQSGSQVLLSGIADDTRYNSNGHGLEPTQNIAEARYSIDSPSWITGTITLSMDPSDGNFDQKVESIQATVDTTGLSLGRHTIFVESKDADGNWGVPTATFIYVVEPGVSPVIEGFVHAGGTDQPLAATVSAGLFNTTTDPSTGYYSMTVISDTYDLEVEAENYAPGYAHDVVAQDYHTVQQNFMLYPFCAIFSDNVENGNQGWTADFPWGITAASSHSPTHSWTDSPTGNYGNNLDIKLKSQVFNLRSYTGMRLNFWQKYQTELNWDYGMVEYSTNGVNWTTIATYTGTQNLWSQVQLPIPALDGQDTGYIRFRFTSDTNTVYDGWYVDDISLEGGGPICIGQQAPTAGFTSNSPVELGQPVNFTNQTTGTGNITYAWDFGDGTGTSTETNPSYTYANIGTYDVSLVANSPYGTDSITHPVTVYSVDLTNVDLTQVTPGPIIAGNMVDFYADLLPNNATKPYTYTIDFGDGSVLTDISTMDPLPLSYEYNHPGAYTVKISLQNAGMALPVSDALELEVVLQFFLPVIRK